MRTNNMSSNKKPNVWLNFGYNAIYQLLLIIIPIITTPLISRVFGANGVGEYAYAYSIANYYMLFEMLGVNNYGNRTISKVKDDKQKLSKTFFEIYALQLLSSIIVIAVYLIYTFYLSNNKDLSLIMTINVLSGAIDINWFFYGMERFDTTVKKNAIIKILTTILLFIFIRKPSDLFKYALINSCGLFLSQMILWLNVKKYVSFVKINVKNMMSHFKPNISLFVPVIAISLYKIMDKIMLGHLSNKMEVGYYDNCDKLVQVPLAIVTALGMAMLPRISNLVANNDVSGSTEYMKKSIFLVLLVASPMAFGIMAISPELVPVFYGEGFDKCVEVFQYLMPSCIFLAIANVVRTQYIIPFELDSIYLLSVFAGSIVNLIVNLLTIRSLGSIGAAIGTLCSEAAVCLIQVYAVSKRVPIKKYIIDSIQYPIFGFMMYVLVRIIKLDMNIISVLGIKVFIGALIYVFLVLSYFFMFKKEELKAFLN